MHFAKHSVLNYRLNRKKYKYNYMEILISLLIRHGKKKFSKKIAFYTIILLKKFYFIRLRKNLSNFFFFFTKLLDSYRPKVSLVFKKSGSQYHMIPWYININKSRVMLIRWVIQSAKLRFEHNFIFKLYSEFVDLFTFKGLTIKKLEEYYTIAVSNRPFLKLLRKKRKISKSRLKKFIK